VAFDERSNAIRDGVAAHAIVSAMISIADNGREGRWRAADR
jgi:hypothetical protein